MHGGNICNACAAEFNLGSIRIRCEFNGALSEFNLNSMAPCRVQCDFYMLSAEFQRLPSEFNLKIAGPPAEVNVSSMGPQLRSMGPNEDQSEFNLNSLTPLLNSM